MGKLSHYKTLKGCHRQLQKILFHDSHQAQANLILSLVENLQHKAWIVLLGDSNCFYLAKNFSRFLGRKRAFSNLTNLQASFNQAEQNPDQPYFVLIRRIQYLSWEKELATFVQCFKQGFYEYRGEQKALPKNIFVLATVESFDDIQSYLIPESILDLATIIAINNLNVEGDILEDEEDYIRYQFGSQVFQESNATLLEKEIIHWQEMLRIDLLQKTASLDRVECQLWQENLSQASRKRTRIERNDQGYANDYYRHY